MGIRPLTRRTATRAALVLAALLPPVPAHALGASTARLPACSLPAHTSALTARLTRDIRSVRTALVSRLRALRLALPGDREPSCGLVGHRQDHPAGAPTAPRLRTALTLAREMLRAAASRRPRFPARTGEAVSGARAGSVPHERPPGRRRPDARP
ncbi:hypothetical protein AAW14_14005 [Streptomyces hygroscopicus]|uniref:hypothetical protein n=1 Tax=Streptomyces hygroscopicus TaxID=1912 RepID=UPI00223F261A|nr:hypothetical protein [Streptomyces hygroscopicus]MCW7943131.1 hypothetical protein [Streptomyces hygroscopicus]